MFRCNENCRCCVNFVQVNCRKNLWSPFLAVPDIGVNSRAYPSYRSNSPPHHCKTHIPSVKRWLLWMEHAYPWKTAFSWMNLLKSAISLSMASRICICRTIVHTVSLSESIAVLSSYAPREDWNLYLCPKTIIKIMYAELRLLGLLTYISYHLLWGVGRWP